MKIDEAPKPPTSSSSDVSSNSGRRGGNSIDLVPDPYADSQYHTLFNHQRQYQQQNDVVNPRGYNRIVPYDNGQEMYRLYSTTRSRQQQRNRSFFTSTWFRSFIGMLLAIAVASGASLFYKSYISPLLKLVERKRKKEEKQQQNDENKNHTTEESKEASTIRHEIEELRKIVEQKTRESSTNTTQLQNRFEEQMLREDVSKTKNKLKKLQEKLEQLQSNNQELKMSLSTQQYSREPTPSKELASVYDMKVELAQIKGMLMNLSQPAKAMPFGPNLAELTKSLSSSTNSSRATPQKKEKLDVEATGYSASYNYYDNPNYGSDSDIDIGQKIDPFEESQDIMGEMYRGYKNTLGMTDSVKKETEPQQNIQTVFVEPDKKISTEQVSSETNSPAKPSDSTEVPVTSAPKQNEDEFDYSMFDGHAPSFDEIFQSAKSAQSDHPWLKDLFKPNSAEQQTQQPENSDYQPLDSSQPYEVIQPEESKEEPEDIKSMLLNPENESEPKFQKSKLFELFGKIGKGDLTIDAKGNQIVENKKGKKKKKATIRKKVTKKSVDVTDIDTTSKEEKKEKVEESVVTSQVVADTESSTTVYDAFETYDFENNENWKQFLQFTVERGTLEAIEESQRDYALLKLKAKFFVKQTKSDSFDFTNYCILKGIVQKSTEQSSEEQPEEELSEASMREMLTSPDTPVTSVTITLPTINQEVEAIKEDTETPAPTITEDPTESTITEMPIVTQDSEIETEKQEVVIQEEPPVETTQAPVVVKTQQKKRKLKPWEKKKLVDNVEPLGE